MQCIFNSQERSGVNFSAWFTFIILLSSTGVELDKTCPNKNVDLGTGRCTVKIAFVPQELFAFPVLDGRLDILQAKKFEEELRIFERYKQLYPPGHAFSAEELAGCRKATFPCPALGIDMDIMSKLFGEMLDWDFTLVPFYTYPSALYAARIGSVDMAWAALSITAKREACVNCPVAASSIVDATAEQSCCLDFSHQYWEGGLAVAAKVSDVPSFLEALFTTRMLNVFSFFLITLFVAGHIMWLIERRSQFGQVYFPKPYTLGVSQGIYWACTTATTVGYGDTGPTTSIGKLFTMGWMFIGIVFAGIVSGLMASAITVNDLDNQAITSFRQLNGQKVCYVPGWSEAWLKNQGGGVRQVRAESLVECFVKLNEGSVDAILYDKPWLDRFKNIGRLPDNIGISKLFQVADYGVAFPEDSDLTHKVSAGLIHIMSDDDLRDRMREQWISEDLEETAASDESDEDINWIKLIIALTLIAWLIVASLSQKLWKIVHKPVMQKRDSKNSADEPFRTPAFNVLEMLFRETLTEIQADHTELSETHGELASKCQDMQKTVDALEDTLRRRLFSTSDSGPNFKILSEL